MAMKPWVRLPTAWIREGGLKKLRWNAEQGSNNVAALMTLAVIAHHADEETGTARLTYDELSACTTHSRAKISGGLKVLEELGVVGRNRSGRGTYQLCGYDITRGWGKLPARPLYSHGRVSAFEELTLRNPISLVALKLYFLFVAQRGNDTNLANISYDKIVDYTDIRRDRIKSGLSVLAANSLIQIEHFPSQELDGTMANAYRVVHVDSHVNMGTRGRGLLGMVGEAGLGEFADPT